MDTQHETTCTCLTPAGRGAVAVVALHGPDSESALDIGFRPAAGILYSRTGSRPVVYGIWQDTREDVIVVRRGVHHFEVHCHGGNVASEAIIRSLRSANIKSVPPREFASDREGLWRVEIEWALTRATTDRAAIRLLGQLDRLPHAIDKIRQQIAEGRLESAKQKIHSLLNWSQFGYYLSNPRSVVLCGQPNVGKSSLINAIVGYQRTIVHDLPGTTRDVVSQQTAFNGWPVEVKDTAGLRENTASPIESIGVEKAKSHIESAQFTIVVFDRSLPWTEKDDDLIALVGPDLIVFNKMDLVADGDPHESDRPDGIPTSVTTHEGIALLIESIGSQLVGPVPGSDQPFPICQSQTERLLQTLEHINDGQTQDALDALSATTNGGL